MVDGGWRVETWQWTFKEGHRSDWRGRWVLVAGGLLEADAERTLRRLDVGRALRPDAEVGGWREMRWNASTESFAKIRYLEP